ncbi:hypothetical protein BT69DRAFT_1279083 [Atractiella rhizophila]|nr:hypothetical protein BT69DRAFT_1279083 [Atractiella rhizophila]
MTRLGRSFYVEPKHADKLVHIGKTSVGGSQSGELPIHVHPPSPAPCRTSVPPSFHCFSTTDCEPSRKILPVTTVHRIRKSDRIPFIDTSSIVESDNMKVQKM